MSSDYMVPSPSTTLPNSIFPGHAPRNHTPSDRPCVKPHTNKTRDSHLQLQSLYEVVGKVLPLEGGHGLGLRVLSSTLWPKNERGELPDVKLFEAVVDATHRYKEIFYEDGDAKMNGDGGY
jgi:hypothetical protein